MNKSDWYKDRILWRANKNDLLSKRCALFSSLDDKTRSSIISVIGDDAEPVIIFWDCDNKWTSIGTNKVVSYINGNVSQCFLDEIDKALSIYNPRSYENIKIEAEFIEVGPNKALIWAPAGPELFALMNILLMFPLKSP